MPLQRDKDPWFSDFLGLAELALFFLSLLPTYWLCILDFWKHFIFSLICLSPLFCSEASGRWDLGKGLYLKVFQLFLSCSQKRYLEPVIPVLLEIGSGNPAICPHYGPANIAIIEHGPYLQMGLASRLIRLTLERAEGGNTEGKRRPWEKGCHQLIAQDLSLPVINCELFGSSNTWNIICRRREILSVLRPSIRVGKIWWHS